MAAQGLVSSQYLFPSFTLAPVQICSYGMVPTVSSGSTSGNRNPCIDGNTIPNSSNCVWFANEKKEQKLHQINTFISINLTYW